MIFRKFFFTCTITSFLLASAVAQAQTSAEIVQNALNASGRPAEDAADDARRMPLEVLSFAGIEAGMTILEMEAGGGYYTEILSRAVGSNGSVIMQNPPAFDSFSGEAVQARLANNRLANVTFSRVNFDELEADDNSVDMVTWILGPHELWFEPGGQNLGDPAGTFAEIERVLKPGGVFLAIDHDAAADSGTDVGGSLHRIYEGHIVELAEGAGLSLVRSSNLHSNESDPLDIGVFDPAIQGRTDKFVLLYQK
ncbi:MAG: methyltransferase domain-containing protein [Gammaproteobacteria bacterium]|nr:methyltransferase domain-containing protein [Gammaproteobacteria bacterium]